jgi:hypothetical protein
MLEFHLVAKLVATDGQALPKECTAASGKMCLAVFGVLFE